MSRVQIPEDSLLRSIPKSASGVETAAIAAKCGFTSFQITARLASMERRGLIRRVQFGRWSRLVDVKGSESVTFERGKVVMTTDPMNTIRGRDKGVTMVKSCRGSKMFWGKNKDSGILFFRMADGLDYRRAQESEDADMIADYRDSGLGIVRLVRS